MMPDPRPIDVKNMTLAALRKAREDLSRPDFLFNLRQGDSADRKAAAHQMFLVEDAYQEMLRNRMDTMRKNLAENSGAITAAITDFNKKTQNLAKVKTVLDGVTSLLNAVGKVVKLIGL